MSFVDDGFIEADFIGGPWDGKTYAIPHVHEWRIAAVQGLSMENYRGRPDKLMKYDVAVYRHITNGIYWFVRLEKASED